MSKVHKYIFPEFLAKAMAKVDQRTQYEASMMSMTFICIGIILSAVYASIYMQIALWFKIVIGINAFFGIVFMAAYLITTYQQYQTYMDAKEFMESQQEKELKIGKLKGDYIG